RLVAVHLDSREVDEHVLPAVDGDEAVTLLGVEPLDGALCHGALPSLLSCPGTAVAVPVAAFRGCRPGLGPRPRRRPNRHATRAAPAQDSPKSDNRHGPAATRSSISRRRPGQESALSGVDVRAVPSP